MSYHPQCKLLYVSINLGTGSWAIQLVSEAKSELLLKSFKLSSQNCLHGFKGKILYSNSLRTTEADYRKEQRERLRAGVSDVSVSFRVTVTSPAVNRMEDSEIFHLICCLMAYTGRPLKKIPRIIVWRVGPLQYRLPPLVNGLGTHLFQCISWCERLHSTSVNSFLKTFNTFAHSTMGDL